MHLYILWVALEILNCDIEAKLGGKIDIMVLTKILRDIRQTIKWLQGQDLLKNGILPKNVLPTSLTSNDQQNAWWTGPGFGDQ